jgi:hypothetical protein
VTDRPTDGMKQQHFLLFIYFHSPHRCHHYLLCNLRAFDMMKSNLSIIIILLLSSDGLCDNGGQPGRVCHGTTACSSNRDVFFCVCKDDDGGCSYACTCIRPYKFVPTRTVPTRVCPSFIITHRTTTVYLYSLRTFLARRLQYWTDPIRYNIASKHATLQRYSTYCITGYEAYLPIHLSCAR